MTKSAWGIVSGTFVVALAMALAAPKPANSMSKWVGGDETIACDTFLPQSWPSEVCTSLKGKTCTAKRRVCPDPVSGGADKLCQPETGAEAPQCVEDSDSCVKQKDDNVGGKCKEQ